VIELRRLRAFVALAEEGHVTRAAERLGMHQPGLTRLLSGLETELSVRPMDRHPRGVRPTEAGRVLLSEARAVLVRAHGLEEIVRRAARDESGRLSLGVTHSAALHPLFPRVLRQLRTDFPGVAIELEEAVTGDLMLDLNSDGLILGSPAS
jgi:DNA-binding transcriptional LysR family regulator